MWRGVNAKTLNRRRVPIFGVHSATRLAISTRIINRHDIDASLFCAKTRSSDCERSATVNARLGGILGSVRPRTLRMINVGQSSTSGSPWPGYIASIRLLRTSPRSQPQCKLRRSPARCSSHASPKFSGIGMRVHNDPIASQHSGNYLTMTRDKAPNIKANESDRGANGPRT